MNFQQLVQLPTAGTSTSSSWYINFQQLVQLPAAGTSTSSNWYINFQQLVQLPAAGSLITTAGFTAGRGFNPAGGAPGGG
ncbi:hypothetical protein F511_23310 [Dorcoceras hygrometricum]|uniref:Uncharacterized protein n=1 Tax=Dorcoceras hygrometricum TaxID=472368 RepID=A0A2Z7B7Q6_9LAMI|nr:hypothetical protein F511_23310 [Dorcoceras hygrometricum]